MNASSPDPAPAVWLCATRTEPESTPYWLTDDEQQRLNTLNEPVRGEFLASRWLIRRALAEISGQPAQNCYPAAGRVRCSAEPPGWQLSISHSHGLAGCAVSKGTPIGLDLEPLSRQPQWRKVSARWFSAAEHEWLQEADDPQTFLKVWTLKEAWLKATGRGIADNLQTLTVGHDFSLYGDRPGEAWRASLGYCCEHLVALVYQVRRFPVGRLITGPTSLDSPEAGDGSDTLTIQWVFHKQIGCNSEQA